MRLFDSLEQISLEVILDICPLFILAYCYFNELTSSIKVNDNGMVGVVHAQTKALIVGTKVQSMSTNESMWNRKKGMPSADKFSTYHTSDLGDDLEDW